MEGAAERRRAEGGLAAEVLPLCQGADEGRPVGGPSELEVFSLGRGAAAIPPGERGRGHTAWGEGPRPYRLGRGATFVS